MNVKDLELPPHNLEAEKGLLSCIMMDNKILYYITDFKKNFFFNSSHKEIFWIMVDLHSKKQIIDPITIWEYYDNMDELWDISTFVVSPTVYKEYVKIIKDNYVYRDVIKQAQIISWMAYNKESVEDITKKLQKTIDWSYVDDDKLKTIEEWAINRMMEYIQNVEDKKNWINEMAISTWLKDLDNVMNGWLKQWAFNIIAARPAIWKSALWLNIIENVVKQWKAGMFFSMEMPESQIIDRLVSKNSKVSMTKILNADLTQEDIEKISNAWENIIKYPLYINDKWWLNVDNIRATIMEADVKPDVIIVDYIQLMTSTVKTSNEVQEITNITKWLKSIALEFKICVIWLSQLNRWVELRPDKRPVLSDLRGSWSIEQDWDMIIGMFRDDYYDKESDCPNILELNVLKNRHWELKTIYTHYDRTIQSITDSDYKWDNDIF